MLGEKNLYVYCDDNPITRVDVNGQFSLICGLIGATMNVLAGGVAAAVTGQEYTVTDMIAAGLAGIFAGGAGLEGAIAGGVVSAVYTAWCSFRRGDSLTAAIINSGTAFLSTVFISNLSGFAVASEGLEKTIAITWGATYGVGAGGIVASVSRGLSMETAETKRQVKNVPHEKKVGQGRHFNGRTGTSFKFSIWKTATGSLKKRPHKTYIPLRARTV